MIQPTSAPALAKNARTGHPSFKMGTEKQGKGWATRPETFGKYGDYVPNMDLFDRNPRFYIGLWKSWWEQEGRQNE